MVSLLEAKKYIIRDTKMYRDDLKNLPDNFDLTYLHNAIEILSQGQKLNSEYDFHPLKGRRAGKYCIHIPDPNAYTTNEFGELNKYSEWQVFFDKDDDARLIILEETGTHDYMRQKYKTSGKKR